MKTNYPLAVAAILLSIFASNALGVHRSPYPSKPCAPNTIIVVGQEQDDWVRTTLRGSK